MSKQIILKRNAWLSDEDYSLEIPDNWTVHAFGRQKLPGIGDMQIDQQLDAPIGCPPLPQLASLGKNAIILVDDIFRPTPAHRIIESVISRVIQGGIKTENIRILIACGTHRKATEEEIRLKVGEDIVGSFAVLNHDCKADCLFVGKTSLGTPVSINKYVLESDLKIGISSVYPHPVAGFSGGSKILALGASGLETIRVMHDSVAGVHQRTGNIDHAFCREINEIAKMAGMDFCVNLLLNQNREIAAVYAGDPEKSFFEAVQFAIRNYTITMERDVDVVIVDAYPFDLDFQFAYDRGLWPFEGSAKNTVKIILSHCQQGIGGHELFPVSNPILTRVMRRLRNIKLADLTQLGLRIQSIQKLAWRRSLDVIVVSPHITKDDISGVFPVGRVVSSWDDAVRLTRQKIGQKERVSVALYQAAPLMLPVQKGDNP